MARLALRRSERLARAGQGALWHDAAAAIEPLREAVRLAPRDAQARLFLAIAQADAGEPDAALATLAEAIAIEPSNAVLLAETGVVHLDEGRLEQAMPIFERAAAMAPGNALCGVWPLLVKWDLGDANAAVALATRTRDRASRFQARVLVRVERAFLTNARPDVARDACPPPLRRFPTVLDRIWDAPTVRRRSRALMKAGKFDAAASILLQAREDYEGDELLEGLLPQALEGALTELAAEIEANEKRRVNIKAGIAELEADRRDAVFRLADCLLQLERWSDAMPRLDEWWASHTAAGSPHGESHYALALCIASSETSSRLGRYDAALEWVTRGRALDSDRKDLVRVEALARVGIGSTSEPEASEELGHAGRPKADQVRSTVELRRARRLFERFLDGSLYSAEDRLRELITRRRAFIAT